MTEEKGLKLIALVPSWLKWHSCNNEKSCKITFSFVFYYFFTINYLKAITKNMINRKVYVYLLSILFSCSIWDVKRSEAVRLSSSFCKLQKPFLAATLLATSVSIFCNPLLPSMADTSNSIPTLTISSNADSKVRLKSGVEYIDEKLGDVEAPEVVAEGKRVQFLWVLRRDNGYFVASSATEANNEPFFYRVGNKNKIKVLPGLDEGMRGMHVNGIRRIRIPANQGYYAYFLEHPEIKGKPSINIDQPGPIPQDFGPQRQILSRLDRETWNFEIKVTKIKD